jgi:hypothetical protein
MHENLLETCHCRGMLVKCLRGNCQRLPSLQ